MCTRFVYRQREDVITGFNFDIDPAVWNHKVIQKNDRFISAFCGLTACIIPTTA